MFFLLSGKASVVHEGTIVSVLLPNAFFGELGILTQFLAHAVRPQLFANRLPIVSFDKAEIMDAISESEDMRMRMHQWSLNKQDWWKKQKYADEHEQFGGEFVGDYARRELRQVSFFSNASDAFIDEVAMVITSEVYAKGTTIVCVDDDSDALYFVMRGSVIVVGIEVCGSVFGEVGVIMNVKRTASIRAKDDCYLLRLGRDDLYKVLKAYPELEKELEKVAQERYALFEARLKANNIGSMDLFDIEVSEHRLLELEIFKDCEEGFIRELAACMVRKKWDPNDYIIRCGDISDSMFFLAAGEADVITEVTFFITTLTAW
ncbi:cyclic nucleotide-binding-like protein [Chytridium lagenaria]|nr:cyclic nucleotide-binding-like protein [Chytridium lagenaria]